MAKINPSSSVQVEITLVLTESEARALEAISGYNPDSFLRVFYEHLGRAHLSPHEAGLRSLMEAIHRDVPSYLERINRARMAFAAKDGA